MVPHVILQGNNISSYREFATLLYFLSGPPKYFLRKKIFKTFLSSYWGYIYEFEYYMSVGLIECECTFVCILINLSTSPPFSVQSKNYNKNQAEVIVVKGQPNQLELLTCLHKAKTFILAGIFEIIGENSGVRLRLIL